MILAGILVVFLGLLVFGVPVVFSLIISSGLPILLDQNVHLVQMGSIILQKFRSFTLLAIPLFIYAGKLLQISKVPDDLIYLSRALIGKVRGDLAHINVLTSIFFAGISGSSVADVASLGTVIIPAMKKKGYSPEFSATLTAASATIGAIIPPSILMIVYGSIAQTSIAALFLGGIIPGVVIGLSQMVYSYIYARRNHIGQLSGSDSIEGEDDHLSKLEALKRGFFPTSIFVLIIGGILAGIFTPTEAAGFAVVYILLYNIIVKKERNFKDYYEATKKAVIESSTIFFLIAVASFLSWVLTYYKVMIPVIDLVKGSNLSAPVFMIVMMLIYLVIGTFMEPASAMLIFVPLLLPLMDLLEINPTVAGVITVMAIRVGTVTPPYGLSTLMAAKIAETSVMHMMKHIVLFVGEYLLVLIILVYFQDIILILPRIFLS